MATVVERVPCGPTYDEAICACGCSGYDERCDYYIAQYNRTLPITPEHTCCTYDAKARLNSLIWLQDNGDAVMGSDGQYWYFR